MNDAAKFRSAPFAWGKTPLLLPVAALATGIFTAHRLGYPHAGTIWPPLITASLWAILFAFRGRLVTNLRPDLWVLLLAICFTGVWRAGVTHPPNAEAFFAPPADATTIIGGEVVRLRAGENSVRARVKVAFIDRDSVGRAASGQLLAYLPPDAKTAALRVGDRVVLSGKPRVTRAPLNPGAFDGRAYWATQGVYHSLYIKDAARWRHLPTEGFSLVGRAEALRRAWYNAFRRYLSGDRLAVAAALVMGKKDGLSSEIRSAYAETGATHVLAVSGLHVGIIYLLISGLFRLNPYRETFAARVVETLVTILLIWVFAFVSGFSPSVQRAATMFAVIALGKLGLGRTYVVNSLCVAALGMLWVEPKQLFQLGFLLSFMALMGIVWFTGPFQRLLRVGNRGLRAVWSGIAASVGAQLGTMPVSLYVFKQFSWLFWLSGSGVVAFAFLVMAAGVLHGLVAAIFGFGTASAATGWLLSTVVSWQNAFIYFFNEHSWFSWAVVELRSFPLVSALLLAGAILALGAWVHWRKRWYGAVFTVLAAGSLILALPRVQGLGEGAVTTVYHIPYHSLIDYHNEGTSQAVGDSLEQRDLDFNVLPNRKQLGYTIHEPRLVDTLRQFKLGTRAWAVVDKDSQPWPVSWEGRPDYILVRNGFPPERSDRCPGSTGRHGGSRRL